VDDGRLFCFESRPASLFSVQCVSDDRFDTLPVALRSRSRDPRGEVIHERDRAAIRVDASLHQVSIEKEGGKGQQI
jgi:hypothetical protein